MEIEAYKKEAIFWDAYKLSGENLSPIIFIQLYPGLITTKCDYSQKPPRFAFVISIILTILIQILKPLLDIFMLISDLIWAIFRKNTH
jgi:Mg2+/Co2+ transporter CorB